MSEQICKATKLKMWGVALGVVAALLTIYITHWIYKWTHPKCNGVLPPGSMGLPLIGETLGLLTTSYSLDLPPFIKKRIQRYGPVFRTSLGGRPVIVSADAQFNNFIFLQEGRSVELAYMGSFGKLFEQVGNGESRTSSAGAVHKYIRSWILNHLGSEMLKTRVLSRMEEQIHKTLHSWSTTSSVNVKHAAASMIVEFTAKLLFNYDPEKSPEKIEDSFADFIQVLMSFPLNIPGTKFHKCMQGQKKVSKMLKDILKQKLESPENCQGDFLDQATKDMSSQKFLTEEFIVNLTIGILLASFESVSSALTLAVMLLLDKPAALDQLRAENEAILKSRKSSESSLTWEEYKSMTFTIHVINETLRLGSVAPGLLRRVTKDLHINGYTIPSGWTIMMVTSALQLNPDTFEDPLSFNPWRWNELDSTVVSKNFMPFGSGTRQCAGAEYSKVFLATFLHVLVTKYKWTTIKAGKVSRNPILGFGDGIHVRFSEIVT